MLHCRIDRRTFTRAAMALVPPAVAPTVTTTVASESAEPSDPANPVPHIAAFTKPMQRIAPERVASRLSSAGFAGVECPIRSKGRIEPSRIEDELPAHVETLAAAGVAITIAATDINDPDDPATARVLGALAAAGVPAYRMAYYRYAKDTDLPSQIDDFAARMRSLAALNREIGITGLYQNHADYRFFGGPIWDLHRAVQGIEPEHLGVAFDLRHATVEGGRSYPLEWQLIAPHVRAFYVKDFRWEGGKIVNQPLGRGQCDPDFYKNLSAEQKRMPFSLHVEYLRGPAATDGDQVFAAFERDGKKLAGWLES